MANNGLSNFGHYPTKFGSSGAKQQSLALNPGKALDPKR